MIKIRHLKLVILLEYQNIKTFLQKVTFQIGLKNFLWFKKLKILCPEHVVINNLNGEEIVWTFYENDLEKTNQKDFRIEKVIKIKGDNLYVKWKHSFNTWTDKKKTYYKWVNISKPNSIKKSDFDNKLKDVTSTKNELNELSKKLKQYQQKG